MGYEFGTVKSTTHRIQNADIHWPQILQTWLQRLLQLSTYCIIVNQLPLSSCSSPSAFQFYDLLELSHYKGTVPLSNCLCKCLTQNLDI